MKEQPRQRRSPPNQTSLLDFDDESPRESIATSGASSFASSGLFSPSSEMLKSDIEPGNEKSTIPTRTPLSERSDLHSNNYQFSITSSTPKTKFMAKLDYTPSPLSMVPCDGFNDDGGFVVLASQDENACVGMAVPDDQVFDILLFRALKYIVVDAQDPYQSKQ